MESLLHLVQGGQANTVPSLITILIKPPHKGPLNQHPSALMCAKFCIALHSFFFFFFFCIVLITRPSILATQVLSSKIGLAFTKSLLFIFNNKKNLVVKLIILYKSLIVFSCLYKEASDTKGKFDQNIIELVICTVVHFPKVQCLQSTFTVHNKV